MGFVCKLFEVSSFLCWGTPNDLKTFEYWQSCFHKWKYHPYSLYKDKKINHSRFDIVREMIPYIESEIANGTYINHITRHMLGLFHGVKGAKVWRSYLSENAPKRKSDINVIKEALIKIEEIQKEVA